MSSNQLNTPSDLELESEIVKQLIVDQHDLLQLAVNISPLTHIETEILKILINVGYVTRNSIMVALTEDSVWESLNFEEDDIFINSIQRLYNFLESIHEDSHLVIKQLSPDGIDLLKDLFFDKTGLPITKSSMFEWRRFLAITQKKLNQIINGNFVESVIIGNMEITILEEDIIIYPNLTITI